MAQLSRAMYGPIVSGRWNIRSLKGFEQVNATTLGFFFDKLKV